MSYRRKEATCRHRQHPVMWFFLICMLFTHLAGCSSSDNSNNSDSTTLKIGVLLPLTGPDNSEAQQTLEWTCERINAAGGVAGKSLDLVMIDTAETDFADGAAKLADDDSILAVIGPDSSKNLFEVADLFINAQKVLVSPSATSADIFRAFGGMHYIWRTVESDIAQLKVILTIATRRGATRIALITGDDHYGGTFFDWFGFLATELGLEVTAVVRYDQTTSSCEAAMATVLLSEPDFLLAVPSYIDDAVCMARQVGNAAMPVDLFFSDAAMYSALIETLGVDADGLEGVTVTSDQDHGFDQDYFDTFGTSPPDYAAQTYDALLLLAYGLEHSKGAGGKTLAESLEAVVSFRGVATGWNPAGIQQTLDLLRSGANPNICGASGPLDFDKEKFTDVIASTYGHWQMKAGTFIFEEYYSTAASSHAESISSAFNTLASEAAKQQLDGGPYDPSYDPGPLSDLWVLIAAVSKGWDNYRHQADALAFYQQMKANGISDDRIILIMEDDLADNPLNPEPGVIRNEINGKNLYTDVEIDYTLDQLTAFDIMHILANDETNRFDPAIKSSAKDNIFFFLVGHGNSEGVLVGSIDAVSGGGSFLSLLTPDYMTKKIDRMYQNNHFRRLFIAIESCHAGIMGSGIITPGVLLMTSSNPVENSVSANYDTEYKLWRADQFAFHLYEQAKNTPQTNLINLYENLYFQINGSHVNVYFKQYGDLNDIRFAEFLDK